MTLLLLAFVATSMLAAPLGRRLGRRVLLVGLPAPVLTLIWAASQTNAVLDGARPTQHITWVPSLELDLVFRLTPLGLVMTWLIGGVGALVVVYASAYFDDDAELPLGRFTAVLTLFAGAMAALVWSDSLLGLFVFWELTSVCSYLLIGFDDRSESARNAALQALLITGAGGLAMLGGVVLVASEAGAWTISALVADPPPLTTPVQVGAALMLVGAFAKSAQAPFHGWLAGAMAAPTPVSAYLHSATMVKAGVFLVAVLTPALVHTDVWTPMTVGVGSFTMLWGSWGALRRDDLKLVLAASTIATLGLLIALFGLGAPKATFAAVAVLVAHALYKAALFMVVGIVDHAAHSRDLRRLHDLRKVMPATALVAGAAAVSLAALPATAGFVAKEAALEGLLDDDAGAAVVLLAATLAYSVLSAAAIWRFWHGAFGARSDGADELIDPATVHPPGRVVVAPAALLAILGIGIGLVPSVIDPAIGAAATALDDRAGGYHLHAFAGFNVAFALSMAALAGAAALAVANPSLDRQAARLPQLRGAGVVFRSSIAGLLRLANTVAGTVQHGSLPLYLATTLTTAAVVPGVALLGIVGLPDGWVWAASPLQAIAGVAVIATALGVAVTGHRFAAALLLGAVGYLMAILFVDYGAPDLALTQLLVETVAVVAFVFVLRELPTRFDEVRFRPRQVLRLVVSALVGLSVFGFLLATGGDSPTSPADDLIRTARPEGGGRNVVNVILTDIRALDTLGEITVITVAAMGVLALAGARRRSGPAEGSGILELAVRTVLLPLVVLALFLLLSGHNAPGGGFIAGLVASAGLVLRHVSRPDDPPLRWQRFEPLAGVGLLLATGMAVSGWAGGGELFDLHLASAELPVVGTVKATGALPFDIGVFLVVVAAVVAVLQGLGDLRTPGAGDRPPLGDEQPEGPRA